MAIPNLPEYSAPITAAPRNKTAVDEEAAPASQDPRVGAPYCWVASDANDGKLAPAVGIEPTTN